MLLGGAWRCRGEDGLPGFECSVLGTGVLSQLSCQCGAARGHYGSWWILWKGLLLKHIPNWLGSFCEVTIQPCCSIWVWRPQLSSFPMSSTTTPMAFQSSILSQGLPVASTDSYGHHWKSVACYKFLSVHLPKVANQPRRFCIINVMIFPWFFHGTRHGMTWDFFGVKFGVACLEADGRWIWL